MRDRSQSNVLVLGLLAVVVGALIVATTCAGRAQSLSDVLGKLDMLGRWAENCSAPPSHAHPNIIYRADPDGTFKADLIVARGHVFATATVLAAEELPTNRVRIVQTRQNAGTERIVFIFEIDGHRRRTLRSERSDGHTLIADGLFTNSNKPAPWLIRCEPQAGLTLRPSPSAAAR